MKQLQYGSNAMVDSLKGLKKREKKIHEKKRGGFNLDEMLKENSQDEDPEIKELMMKMKAKKLKTSKETPEMNKDNIEVKKVEMIKPKRVG